MKKETNVHGLSRYIPSEIKLEVRKNSGFGCVICGLFIYEYEHIDPDFKNAKTHDSKNICLLCPTHHAKVTKGLITKEEIKKAHENPQSKQQGFVNDFEFTILKRPLTVQIGNIIFNNPSLLLKVDEKELIGIKEDLNHNLLLNANFYDEHGNVILEIIENEWITNIDNWDIDVKGKEIIIKNDFFKTILHVTVSPPHQILFNYIRMFLPNCSFLDSMPDDEKNSGYVKLITKEGIGVRSNKITTGGYINIIVLK